MVLPDRTELIVSRGATLENVPVDVSGAELDEQVRQFRGFLQQRTNRKYRRYASRLYEWLIRPIEDRLAGAPLDTLVFVPGGSLRTIPMSALYDKREKKFLVEKYPVAVIPALTLTDPRALDRKGARTLLAGLTVGVQGYPALESVGPEIDAVGGSFEGDVLRDDRFVVEAVEESLANEEYAIVHIATHGEFQADASDSFILTYDGKIGLEQLGVLVERRRFRDQPIELLTLSACETAVGDDRAALGLAGIAVRAGARSALATLWTVNDQAAADLIGEFYRQLAETEVSKAEALRQAQISLLDARPYNHPGYWAPFLLISNWM